MPKLSSPVLCSLLACSVLELASLGCAMNRPPIMTADAAWSTYKGRLAESCGEKHLDNLSQDELNRLAVKTAKAADTNNQQLISFDSDKACATGSRPACYNTGFLQAEVQTGGLPEFIKTVCGSR